MMDFRNFEVLYGNALKMKNAAAKIEKMSVRMTIQQAAQAQMDVLKKQFFANFPSNMDEARQHPGFDAEQFFRMLMEWPELDVSRQKVRSLMENMNAENVPVPKAAQQIALCYAFNPE